MQQIEIKDKWNGKIIITGKYESIKDWGDNQEEIWQISYGYI